MKTHLKVLIVLASILLLAISCYQDENNLPSNDKTPIYFSKSILGGCNNKSEVNVMKGEEKSDTVIITLTNDTLNIFVGLNYICCAPFVTDCNIKKDSIFITITDTCPLPYQDCYCRCNCYYTFDYYFNSITANNYYWQINLSDPRAENDIIIKMGTIEVDQLN